MLCFALAMWQYSATPFRAMDEFDKNMDPTFQKVSLSCSTRSSASRATASSSSSRRSTTSPRRRRHPQAEIDATTFLKLKAPRGEGGGWVCA